MTPHQQSHRPPDDHVPNHHAHYPGFSGLSGWVAALTMAVGHGRLGQLALELTGVTSQDSVVDIGCGPGNAARLAARRAGAVVGIDPSGVMLRTARWLSIGRSIEWKDGVAEAMPLPDDWASVAWAIATVHHWTDVDAGAAEAARVLRPGGRFLAIERRTTPGASGLASHGWTEPQAARFAESCRHAGFDQVTVAVHDVGRRGAMLTVLALC